MTSLDKIEFASRLTAAEHQGWSVIHKFGRYDSVPTTFTPISGSGFYRVPTSATALEFVSASANDSSAGSGAQEITVIGLDANWDEVTQTLETNGTTPVALTTDLIRLYRWYVSRSGTYATQSSGSHAGDLTIRESGAGPTWFLISAAGFPRGQSQIAAYTVPNGKRAFVSSFIVGVDSNKTASIIFFKRENADDVTTPYSGAMRAQVELDGVTGNFAIMPMTPFGPFPAKTDIGFMGAASTGTAAISVDFEILLQDA